MEYGAVLINGTTILFHVKDTGIGIPHDKQETVFETFRQADMSTTRKYGGTGLGLPITRRLIELMNGTIWFESEPGEGSVFYFTLPYASSEPGAQQKREEIVCAGVTGTLLLVEDNPDNLMLAESILHKSGYKLLIAQNGYEAVAVYKKNHAGIDLILMDIQMPRMGGLEATRLIRSFAYEQKLRRIPIIALTAGAMKGEKEQCLAAGCDLYLTKPVNKKVLHDTIRRCLSGTPY